MDPLAAVILVLVILWALGLGFHVGGSLVHVVLLVALVVLVIRVLQPKG